MPCSDWGRSDAETIRPALDEVTELLCSLCSQLDDEGHGMPEDVRAWWEAHQEKDRQRFAAEENQKRKEEERRRAIAKLSKAEKKALGLKG